MNKTSSTLIPALVYGVNGPPGAHAPTHVVEVPLIDPEILHNRQKMLGTHVQVPALNRCPATLTHAVRKTPCKILFANGKLTFFAAIHCDWGLWGEWTTCSKTCGDGNLTRKRVHSILAQYGGNNCTGNSMDTKHCNVQDSLRATIANLRAQSRYHTIERKNI